MAIFGRSDGCGAGVWGWALAGVLMLPAWGHGQGAPTTPPPVATQGAKAAEAQTPAGAEKVMTKQQARELLDSVDGVMAFVAADTGLPPVVKVKRRLITRDEVSKYLAKSFDEDEGAKRLQRSEIVLKKFGMLNRDFNLRPFLLSLLREQIAGFYDDKTKIVNLLNWVEPDEQKPVLAHELTHAVQDQKVNLEKWGSTGFKGISKTSSEDTARLEVDEQETARQAVTEGQAMVTFVDYALRDSGKTLADAPDIAQTMKDSTGSSSDSPIMARAPLLLQRSLEFPYTDGLAFEQVMLQKGGKKLAFAGVLDRPPSSSFEIMNPNAYLEYVHPPVLRLPDVHALLDAEYEPYDVGVMGELDVEIMASLFGGPDVARALAPTWNGGVYYAGQRKAASAAEKATTASIAVLYFSRWKSDEAAATFERIYQSELGRKYSGLAERTSEEGPGELVYTTAEGDVLMMRSGTDLFVAEGFPVAQARKLQAAVAAVQGVGAVQRVAAPASARPLHELTPALGDFGLVKVALDSARRVTTYTLNEK